MTQSINQILITALNYEFLVTDAYVYFVTGIGLVVMAANQLNK